MAFRASLIKPWLYVGARVDVNDEKILERYGVTQVINLSANNGASEFKKIKFSDYAIDDAVDAPISDFFEEITEKIESERLAGGISIIHCEMGISRAPTMAIAYLMITEQISVNKAFEELYSVRNIINPNFGFCLVLSSLNTKLGFDKDK